MATVVEHHPSDESEDRYSLEVFNALGETITVVTVSEPDIDIHYENEVFSVRAI